MFRDEMGQDSMAYYTKRKKALKRNVKFSKMQIWSSQITSGASLETSVFEGEVLRWAVNKGKREEEGKQRRVSFALKNNGRDA